LPGNSRGRSQAARGYRIENERDVQQLVDLLLEADEDLRHGGAGLDWALLNLPPGFKPVGTSGRLQTWGQIRSLIKADIAPGGPKAKDRNPFACFSDQGYFGLTYNDQTIALPDHLERYCLHTPASLDAHRLDPSQPLLLRPTNTSSFRGVIQMVNYLARKGIGIATPQLRSRLEALKNATGRVRTPAPRFIPTTAELEAWLDQLQQENPLRGWVMAVIACYGLRPHEVWHIERLPGRAASNRPSCGSAYSRGAPAMPPSLAIASRCRCRRAGWCASASTATLSPRTRPPSATGSRPRGAAALERS
jgi:hypothetical protein